MKRISLIISTLIISIAGFSQATGRLVLNKGQKLQVETRGNSVMTQEMMGQSMEITAVINTTSALEVNDASPEKYNLTNTLTHMKMNLAVMGQDMSFDSDKKEDFDTEMGAGFKDVINKPKALVVNGIAQTIPDTTAKAGVSESGKNPMDAMMSGLLGSNNGSEINPAFEIIPLNAVKGYTWIDSTNTPGIIRKTAYTVKEINGNEAIISFDGTLITNAKNESQGMEVTTKQSGTVKGEMVVDITTGILKEKKTNVETTGTLEMMGQEIPMTSKLTMTTTVKAM